MKKEPSGNQIANEVKPEVQANDLPFVVRLACVLFSLIAIVYISVVGKSVLVPLVIGFLMAMLMVPFSNFQERKLKFPRVLSSLLSAIVFSLIILGVFFIIGTQLVRFQEDVPEFKDKIILLFHEVQSFIYSRFEISQEEQIQYVTENVEGLLKRGSGAVGSVLGFLSSLSATAMFTFLAIFFFLLYRSHLVKFVIWCFPPKEGERVKYVVSEIQSVIKQYISALMIQVVLVSFLMFIAYSIIGIKHALLFAILCGVLNLIPYVGVFSATVLAAVVTLATGEPIQALWVIVAVIVVNSIDGNIITPKIIGSKVSLNSFVVLFGIVIAESIWGIAGMFLAIPLLAIFKIVFDNVEGMRPYGFVLGEDSVPTPSFEKYYNRYFKRKRPTDEMLPEALQTEEQNRNQGTQDDQKSENE